METLEEISKILNYFLVEHKKPKQTTNVAEYYEEFEEWRNEMLALKPELSEEYFIDGFNFGLHWNIRMKLKGFRNPPKIMYEAYVRAKIEEAVMEKHDSALDLPKGEQLMRENEVMEAEHNDIITNLKDESVVSHMFDELCQRTPMDFLEENVNGEEQSAEKVQDKSEGNSEYVTEANKGSGHDSNPAEGTHEANQEQGNGNETTQQESGESSNPTEGTKEANQQQSISDNSKADADQNQRNAVGDVLPGGDGAQSTQEEQTENKDAATNNDKSDTSSNMKEGSAYGEGSNDVGNRQNAGSDTVGGTEKSSENSSANQVNEKVEIQKSDAHSETGPEEKINPSNDNG
ncbi:unnamed protein product [Coffea canephora]|uniref:DH200=94 genomic scaffold, scaffold_1612 n=2 Tax=Coffea canephora TaxID=49390 RepID=A0A068VM27_COFCA|nr:unnamed protein product [Coffea canephora]CDP20714.1 unnamed protein product [Coffea canephora]